MVEYTSRWISLVQALTTVMATGKSMQQSKAEICLAMADGVFDLRVKTDAGETLEDGAVQVPSGLTPEDLNWEEGHPLSAWNIAPIFDSRQDPRKIISVELPRVSVNNIWAVVSGSRDDAYQASSKSGRTSMTNPVPAQHNAEDPVVHAAIREVYDDAARRGTKPPNIGEIGSPVQCLLGKQGLKATVARIKALAEQAEHKSRRLATGRRRNARKSAIN